MKTATEIVRPAPYGRMHVWCEEHRCHHPIDKPCDASIKAYRLEFEAEDREIDRKRKRVEREKIKENKDRVQDTVVENIDESEEDELYLDDEGNYTKLPSDISQAARERGFMYRAQQSTFAAEDILRMKDLHVTQEMLEAADKVIAAWTRLRQQMTPPISTA